MAAKKPTPTPATAQSVSRLGNPLDSPWYSTPDTKRKRPSLKLTPAVESVEGLETLRARWNLKSLSAAFDWLVTEAMRGKLPGPPKK